MTTHQDRIVGPRVSETAMALRRTSPLHPHRCAFTIWEALILILILTMLLSMALPALRNNRDHNMMVQSMLNLVTLSASHSMYAADHNNNQWTVTPHDLAEYGDTMMQAVHNYNNSVGGPSKGIMICVGQPCYQLGKAQDGVTYYWLSAAGPMPVSFTSTQPGFGHSRMHNLKSFNTYVGGMFYDSTFYAPKDTVILEVIGDCLDAPFEYCHSKTGSVQRSSYALSPAALFTPELWSVPDGEFPLSDDAIFTNWPNAFKTPTFSQIAYPDLKTHLMEHHWLQNIELGACNPNPVPNWITPPFDGCQPYLFNHSIDSAPVTLFYDGHVRPLMNSNVQSHDARVELWRRDTAFGPNGYFLDHADDDIVDVSHHILTKGGALGRDTLGPSIRSSQ